MVYFFEKPTARNREICKETTIGEMLQRKTEVFNDVEVKLDRKSDNRGLHFVYIGTFQEEGM